MTAVVRAFVRHRAEMACLRRRDDSDPSQGRLEVIRGVVRSDTADPSAAAWEAVDTAIPDHEVELVRRGTTLSVSDGTDERTVHPFLFAVESREIEGGPQSATIEWLPPTAFHTRVTAPGLWESYRRVAPDVDLIRTDETHGAAWLSIRALEALRDTAGAIAFGSHDAGIERIVRHALALREARPSMVVIRHRIDRVMGMMGRGDRTPDAVHDRAIDVIDAALDADRRAAARAAEAIANTAGRVATLSRSGTVAEAIERAKRPALVAESRPAREGVTTAEDLAASGRDVTLTTDAALPGLLREGDVACVLLGADRVLPTGDVVNKVGSYPLVVAAADVDVPVYVVAAADKIAATDAVVRESGDQSSVYDGNGAVAVANPIFERVPGDRLAGVITEEGVLDRAAITERARTHESRASWAERSGSDTSPTE